MTQNLIHLLWKPWNNKTLSFGLYLRNIIALVTSLQQTSDEVPEEVQVLHWQGFLQLLDTQGKVGSNVAIVELLNERTRGVSKGNFFFFFFK